MYRLFLLSFVMYSVAMDNLNIAYQWKVLNFDFPTLYDREEAIRRVGKDKFTPENNLPTGIEVYEDRLFVTIPRWKSGVAASLAYINISEAQSDSPGLHPYPNWEAHQFRQGENHPDIISPLQIRADRCGRLWVLDSGYLNILENKMADSPKLLLYDLKTDKLLRNYTIPKTQLQVNNSLFANIVVEDGDCQNSFAYLADIYHPALVVYSYQAQKSWMVTHHFFHIDPRAGEMSFKDVFFTFDSGLYGLALSAQDNEGYSTLYFHPMTSFDEFTISTKVLRNETLSMNRTATFHEFKRLGSRGSKGQSGASFLDKKSNVLFFASVNLNAIVCWRTTNPNYTKESHSRVFMNNSTMVFPSSITVDSNNTLWVLSNRLTWFIGSLMDFNKDYNFRIFNASVGDAIKNTACDSKMVVNKTIVNVIKNSLPKDKNKPSSSDAILGHSLLLLLVMLFAIFLR